MQFNPNLDPHIRPFEILEENADQVIVRTGFNAVLRKKLSYPMPAFVHFETDTVEKMEAFRFDDPSDPRRFFCAGDDQINGVGDGFARNTAPFVERLRAAFPDFPVFGGVCEGHEMLWRILGSENALLWMGLYPDAIARFVERIHAFNLELVKAQIRAADGMLDGFVIWGDVACKKGMLFSPAFWRAHFKPGVKALIEECHSHGLPVIYHGCGNVNRIFGDFGAGGTFDQIRAAVLTRLNAAKGGGYIFQSDHSVPADVSGERYDYVVKLVREYGRYPLQLGEFDLPEMSR